MSPKLASLARILRMVVAAAAILALVVPEYVEARPKGSGHGARTNVGSNHSAHRSSRGHRPKQRASSNRQSRPSASHSSNRRPGAGQQRPAGGNRNANRNVNRDVNRNVNRDVNRDVDINRNIDGDWDRWDGDGLWGVAAGVAVGTAAVATAAAIGSTYYSLPPGCRTAIIGGIAYHDCGGAWYAPRYSGSDVVYVVVDPPN